MSKSMKDYEVNLQAFYRAIDSEIFVRFAGTHFQVDGPIAVNGSWVSKLLPWAEVVTAIDDLTADGYPFPPKKSLTSLSDLART